MFPEFEVEDLRFIYAKKVEEFLKVDTQLFSMLASLKVDTEVVIVDLPMVYEFLDAFPYDNNGLPPEREVVFAIELVPSTRPVSMAPYKMFASELGELKNRL